jgi:hypothetical protein
MIQGSPTPRNGQRDIPGSARSRQQNGRPDSAKPKFNRNPITVNLKNDQKKICKAKFMISSNCSSNILHDCTSVCTSICQLNFCILEKYIIGHLNI